MSRALPPALALALVLGSGAAAAPLYLGDEKFDTDDRPAMAAIVEHCTTLAQPAEQAFSTDTNELAAPSETGDPPVAEAAAEDASPGIEVDILASDGNNASKEQPPNLSGIGKEDCGAAGVIY